MVCCGDPGDCSRHCEGPHHEITRNGQIIDELHVFSDEWLRRFFELSLTGGELWLVSSRRFGKMAASEAIREALAEEFGEAL